MKTDKATLLAGLKIIKSMDNGFSRVSINYNAFQALRGSKPALPFAATRDADNQPVRVFDIEGTKLYSCFKKGDVLANVAPTTTFVMRTEDAEALGAISIDALAFSGSEASAAVE